MGKKAAAWGGWGVGRRSGSYIFLARSSSASPSALDQDLLLLYNITIGTPHGDEGGGGTTLRPWDPRRQYDNRNNDNTGRRSRDRFYHALYSVLSDPAMLSGRRHITVYFNLIYKSLKNDKDDEEEHDDDHNDMVRNVDGWSKETKEKRGRRAREEEGGPYPPDRQLFFLSREGLFEGRQYVLPKLTL